MAYFSKTIALLSATIRFIIRRYSLLYNYYYNRELSSKEHRLKLRFILIIRP
jgi:hypothetical protein